jgi:5-methylcytosine-specific restriction protein A
MGLKNLQPIIRSLDTRIAKPQAKETESHYGTAAHKEWAAQVLARANRRCERCGANGRLYADHIQEIKDAPDLALSLDNGQALCASCHTKKTIISRNDRF